MFLPVLGMTNPMTSTGDLIISNDNAGTPARLAVGSGAQVLGVTGGKPGWVTNNATPAWTVVAQSSTLNPAVLGSYYVLSGASFTITLPTAASVAGQGFIFEHQGTSLTQVYTFNTTSAQTIGGVASGSYALYTNGETLYLVSDGSNWQISQHSTNTGLISGGTISFTATSAYVFTWSGNQSIVAGDTYSDGSGHTYTVSTTSNTTTGTFSGTANPAATGTLTRVTGTGVTPITWTSRTVTGAPVIGTTTTNAITWYRQGRFAVMNFALSISGAGTAGSGDYLLAMPSNMSIDTAAIAAYISSIGTYLPSVAAANPSILYTLNTNMNSTFSTTTFLAQSFVPFVYSSAWFRVGLGWWSSATQTLANANFGNWGGSIFGFDKSPQNFNWTMIVPISGWQP